MAEATQGRLDTAKAQRIVAAMRKSVAERGYAGATFDHVAREAGVSRGLLHYYFGSKEQLLVQVVRNDCEVRLGAMSQALEPAASAEAIVGVLVTALEDALAEPDDQPGFALIFELFSASRHNEELRVEMAELYRLVRDRLAGILEQKHAAGVISLRGDAPGVASVLFAMADGIALQAASDPSWESSATFANAMQAALYLLGSE